MKLRGGVGAAALSKRRVERRDVAVTKRRVERRDVAVTKRRVEHAT